MLHEQQYLVFRQDIGDLSGIKVNMMFPEAALQLAHQHRFGKKFWFSQQANRRHNRNTALPQAIHKRFCRRAGRHDVLDNDNGCLTGHQFLLF